MENLIQATTESMTAAALWINQFFQNFDHSILKFYADLHAGGLGKIFDVLFTFITYLGEDGIFLLLLGAFLIIFKKTRKAGLTVIFAVGFGAVFTNLTIKDFVARPRPYATTDEYFNWWYSVRAFVESEYSFPSGHTTAASAAFTSLFLCGKKKYSWLAFLPVIAIGASRNYLMVHYPSDIIGGMIVGFCAAVISYIIMTLLFDKLFKRNKLGAKITGAAPVENLALKIQKNDEKKADKLTKVIIAVGVVILAAVCCLVFDAKIKKEIVSDKVIEESGYSMNADGLWEYQK